VTYGTVRLLQLDGKLPNLALMRLAHHWRAKKLDVDFHFAGSTAAVDRAIAPVLERPGWVFASLIFEKTRPIAEHLRARYPAAVIGGTGWDVASNLEGYGVATDGPLDYSIYPSYQHSIGFTQRGCRLKCDFCVVPRKEGKVRETQTVAEVWRGDPHPKHLVLLDNDFFGQPRWRDRIREIRDGGFKVNFCQGINARLLRDEAAEAIASVPYYDSKFERRQIYTAWDSIGDRETLFRGLAALTKHGIRPSHIMVYVLVGYWRGPAVNEDDLARIRELRAFGAVPYPMPYARTKELVGFQRWVHGAYDKRITWDEWTRASYRPERLGWSRTADGQWVRPAEVEQRPGAEEIAA
jgi:hypothetical protein